MGLTLTLSCAIMSNNDRDVEESGYSFPGQAPFLVLRGLQISNLQERSTKHMNLWKRMGAAVLAGTLALSLVACGGG